MWLKGHFLWKKSLRIIHKKMADIYLSETFFRIWLSLLLFELRHHQMLQTRWIILYTFIQRIANINQTGVLDNDTMTMMARPRCGIPDVTLGDMDINRFGGVDEDLPDTGCFLNVPDVTRSAHPLLMLLMLCFLFNAIIDSITNVCLIHPWRKFRAEKIRVVRNQVASRQAFLLRS